MADKVETIKFILEVKRRSDDGALWTSHRPATPGDLERMKDWPSKGLHQVAHALFIESLRREAYMLTISKMGNGEDLGAMEPKDLDASLRARIIELLDQFSVGAVHNALDAASR